MIWVMIIPILYSFRCSHFRKKTISLQMSLLKKTKKQKINCFARAESIFKDGEFYLNFWEFGQGQMSSSLHHPLYYGNLSVFNFVLNLNIFT